MPSTGETLALMGLSALAGAGARKPAINRSYQKGHQDGYWLGSFEKEKELAPRVRSLENDKGDLRREILDLTAEVARLKELILPEALSQGESKEAPGG